MIPRLIYIYKRIDGIESWTWLEGGEIYKSNVDVLQAERPIGPPIVL